jgi:hypothetical protein
MARPSSTDDSSLKRLGGGRWQTRDERFTIEPQSGTWVVVDAEQTDDLGLPLVRGPFRSLGDAKEAITGARSSPQAASPLAERLKGRAAKRDAAPVAESRPSRKAAAAEPPPSPTPGAKAKPRPTAADEPPAEPRWIGELDPEPRRHARRLIARLEAAGAPDPEGMARRDVVGDVPAVTTYVLERELAELGPDADPAKVAALLAEGRDEDLGVRWRLVDGDGRPITLDRRTGRSRGGRAR